MKLAMLPFLICAIVFGSCRKTAADFNQNQIRVFTCQSFNIDGKILSCCLDSVTQDSRCPSNVVCIWQGIGVARFTANDHLITLATGKFGPYSRDTTIDGFKIELVGLTPYPEFGKAFSYSEYTAELKVSR